MTSDPTEADRHSSSRLWLVAGIPALLVIAFLIYTVVARSSGTKGADPASAPMGTRSEAAPEPPPAGAR